MHSPISSMATPLMFVTVFLIFAFTSIMPVHSQIDTCGTDTGSFLPAPFNMSGLVCKPVWKTFILRYHQTHDGTMTIVLSAIYTSGWISIGFSPDGMMAGSSAMVGWIDTTGRAFIKQYDLRGRSASGVVVDEGKSALKSISPKVVLYGVNIYLMFQVRLSKPVMNRKIILAHANEAPEQFRLTKHDDRTSISFEFSSGGSTVSSSHSSYQYQLKQNHGILAIFGWGVLLPAGVIIARYIRHKDPLWFHLHVVVQMSGYLVGLAGVVAGISLYDKLHSNFRSHKSLGIIVLALGSLQVIAFFIRPDKESKLRRYWNWYHNWLGRLVLLLAAINIVLGLQTGDVGGSWKFIYGFVLSTLLVIHLVLEIRICWSKKTVSPASV